MALEIKIEETENGFLFKDPLVKIEVATEGDHYKLLWTNEGEETKISPLSEVRTSQEAYREFRNSISDYWLSTLGLFFVMNNKERIDELFKPLAKYK